MNNQECEAQETGDQGAGSAKKNRIKKLRKFQGSNNFDNVNPILHTRFRDSCFTCDGSWAIQVFLYFLKHRYKILGRYAKKWNFQQNNILQYYFSKSGHGYQTSRCINRVKTGKIFDGSACKVSYDERMHKTNFAQIRLLICTQSISKSLINMRYKISLNFSCLLGKLPVETSLRYDS